MREIRVNIFLSAGVLLILIALAVINVTLQKRNTELARQIDFARTVLSAANAPKPGTTMPDELPVILPTGASGMLSLRYSAPRMVLLLFDPNCSACEDNWPYWDKLRNDENSGGAFLPVSTSQNISKAFLERHHIAGAVVGVVNQSLQKSLNMAATPETILTENGIVRQTWFGVLSNDDVRAILNALKN
jgi:hypothetical protein